MIVDAENLILGRMASFVAKKALLGERVDVINCEKAVVTGKKNQVFSHYKKRLELGQPHQGPFMQRRPDKFVRRAIRGMLPHKQEKGRKAFSRVKCYLGVPDGLGKERAQVKNANVDKVPNLSYVSVAKICEQMGGKR